MYLDVVVPDNIVLKPETIPQPTEEVGANIQDASFLSKNSTTIIIACLIVLGILIIILTKKILSKELKNVKTV